MRWNDEGTPRHGATRQRRAFLLLPKCVAGEWRWLEGAAWEEQYDGDTINWAADYTGWYPVRWLP